MKKTITLLFISLLSFSVSGQNIESKNDSRTKSIHNLSKPSKDYIKIASQDLIVGSGLVLGGSALAMHTILNVTENDAMGINTALYITSGILAATGTFFVIKGYINLGKASKRLNYEIAVDQVKLSISF